MADDYQADDAAWGKQYDDQQAAQKQQEAEASKPPTFLQKWVTGPVGRVTASMIDGAVSAAEDPEFSQPGRIVKDVAAGAATAAVNTADSAVSALKGGGGAAMGITPDMIAGASPVWEHAKQHLLDFRDALAVKDPSLVDNLTQGVAQLAIPFAGYSRALSMFHGVLNTVAAGAVTDATALTPHDMRMADLLAVGRTTEGKLGDALRALGPHGLNAYVNYLTSRKSETEAQGRFKNVLDGLGVNAVSIPLLHAAAVTLKQGQRALRAAADMGGRQFTDFAPPPAPAIEEK